MTKQILSGMYDLTQEIENIVIEKTEFWREKLFLSIWIQRRLCWNYCSYENELMMNSIKWMKNQVYSYVTECSYTVELIISQFKNIKEKKMNWDFTV